jgi:FkbM family methyltransferase
MGIGESIRRKFEGTRLEPVIEGVRRARWPRLWRVGRKDHEALTVVLPFLLRRDFNCVDVGANQGEILEFFVHQCPGGRHHAFEPLPHHAAHLRQHFPGVTIHELALSDASGQTTFFQTLGDDAYSGLRRTADAPKVVGVQEINVTVARLDDVLDPAYRVDVLKIDVEGAELAVLRGARRTLATHHPTVVFEFQRERAESYGEGPGAYFDLLCVELGYALYRVDGIGPLTREQLQETFDEGECFNFVARAY